MNKATSTILLTFATISLPTSSTAFEVKPAEGMHEAMTFQSIECARDASSLPISDCPRKPLENINPKKLERRQDYQRVVSTNWPDGPTGINNPTALIRIGTTFTQCRNYLKKFGINTNLFCRSHYGDLQFLHAMASVEGESASLVAERALSWARFLYEVATGTIAASDSLCEIFKKEGKEGGRFAPMTGLWTGDETVCKPGKEWTVYTLFNWKCNKIYSWNGCSMGVDEDGSWTRARAVGALLHMIQDSYALGHTDRLVDEKATPAYCGKSVISCLPIREFHAYHAQESKLHGLSDNWPSFDSSCFISSRTVDDPIVSGANIIRSVDSARPWAEVAEYLVGRVFQTHPDSRNSAAGECFKSR